MRLDLYDMKEQKPSAKFKVDLERAFNTFIYITLGRGICENIKVDKIDLILEMTTNFCNAHDIGTRWIKNHLEPTMRERVKRNTKSIRFDMENIIDMFKERVLDRYTDNDPFKLDSSKKKWEKCKPLCYLYSSKTFRVNRTYVLTHKDINDVIDFLGMQEYREEILSKRCHFKYETICRYFDKEEIPEYEKAVKELCEETGAKYIGIIEQPKCGTELKEDEAFICDCTEENDGSRFTYMARVRAYNHSIIDSLDYRYKGMLRF